MSCSHETTVAMHHQQGQWGISSPVALYGGVIHASCAVMKHMAMPSCAGKCHSPPSPGVTLCVTLSGWV